MAGCGGDWEDDRMKRSVSFLMRWKPLEERNEFNTLDKKVVGSLHTYVVLL